MSHRILSDQFYKNPVRLLHDPFCLAIFLSIAGFVVFLMVVGYCHSTFFSYPTFRSMLLDKCNLYCKNIYQQLPQPTKYNVNTTINQPISTNLTPLDLKRSELLKCSVSAVVAYPSVNGGVDLESSQ
jgi:hypothetical protein